MRGVITGDFSSAYKVEVTSTEFIEADSYVVEIGPKGMIGKQGPFTRDTRTTVEAKWLGECKIWMWPGDIFFAYGKINLREWPHLTAPEAERK